MKLEQAAFRLALVLCGCALAVLPLAGYITYTTKRFEQAVINAAVDTVICEDRKEDCTPYNLALILAKDKQEGLIRQAWLMWVFVIALFSLPLCLFYVFRWILLGRWKPLWPL